MTDFELDRLFEQSVPQPTTEPIPFPKGNGQAGPAKPATPALALEPRILDRLTEELRQGGLVGEEETARLLFLAVVTRHFERVVSVALKGPSAGGKSFLLEQVLRFFPPSAFRVLTSMSERALVYDKEPLTHRMLVIYEATGLEGDVLTYLIRSLLSEGQLRYETVIKTKRGMEAVEIVKPGPTGLLTSTTAAQLHPENETRILSVVITDTPEQTAAIMLAQAGLAPALDVKPWHQLSSWLAANVQPVDIPYAHELARLVPPVAVRLRRDFKAMLLLIAAHALLHQRNRESVDGRVVATIEEDYRVVRDIVAPLIADAVERTVPETIRETVRAVAALTPGDEDKTTITAVAKHLAIDRSATSRRVAVAVDRGYLRNLQTKERQPAQLVKGEPLPDDQEVLPSPERLEEACTCARAPEGVKQNSPQDERVATEKEGFLLTPSNESAHVHTLLEAGAFSTVDCEDYLAHRDQHVRAADGGWVCLACEVPS